MLKCLIINGKPLPADLSPVMVPWWSITKTVLAAAALCLVRDGRIGLDERIEEGPFTLRQLLKHQAGLADYSELKDYHSAVAAHHAPWPAEEMLQRLDASRLRYEPGAGWRYSNVGYLLVVRLIERVTGQSLEEALTQWVFRPLGLTRVQLAKTPEDLREVRPPSMATYHPGWVYHGLLMGPLCEAALMLDSLLAGRLLPSTLLEDMQDAIVLGGPIPGRPWATPGYGLGLMVGETNSGHRLIGHTGVGPGSVVAVYRCSQGDQVATCAVFSEEHDEGAVESEALTQLLGALGVDEKTE